MQRVMPDILTLWAFASDAERLCAVGAGCWLLAGVAAVMDWRRGKSRALDRLEQVGWVPWTGVFMTAAMIGGGCLATGLPVVMAKL